MTIQKTLFLSFVYISLSFNICFAQESWTPTSLINAPSARSSHTAVWTGNVMIVWGGWDPYPKNTGGRYDPIPNSWQTTSIINAPSERYNHTAIWSGNKMIVWGGEDLTTEFNTGGIYDPVLDIWTSISINNAPIPRSSHTAVWTGLKMIIWGGLDSLGFTNTGAIYDPSTNNWQSISILNAPSARVGHTAIWTGTKMIVWGGHTVFDSLADFNTGGIYDPITNTWQVTSLVNAPVPRTLHGAVWTGSKMIVWGGTSYTSGTLNSGGIYDPLTNSWQSISTTNSPTPRYVRNKMIWTGTKFIVWGSYTTYPNYVNTGGIYDPILNSWQSTTICDWSN